MITEIVVWGALWFLVMPALGYMAAFILIPALASLTGSEGVMVTSVFVSWLAASAWGVYCVIQVVFHIIALVEVIAA